MHLKRVTDGSVGHESPFEGISSTAFRRGTTPEVGRRRSYTRPHRLVGFALEGRGVSLTSSS